MTVKSDPILSSHTRTELEYALRADIGLSVGTRASQTPVEVSDGVEFEIGPDGGIFVGTVPTEAETPLDLEYSDRTQPAEGVLYVYVADLDTIKERTNGDVSATYAALHYESEFLRALSIELQQLVADVYDIDADTARFERYPSDDSGVYFVLPLPP